MQTKEKAKQSAIVSVVALLVCAAIYGLLGRYTVLSQQADVVIAIIVLGIIFAIRGIWKWARKNKHSKPTTRR